MKGFYWLNLKQLHFNTGCIWYNYISILAEPETIKFQYWLSGLVFFFRKKTIFSFPVEKSGKKLEETGKNGKNWKKLKTLFSKGNIITKYITKWVHITMYSQMCYSNFKCSVFQHKYLWNCLIVYSIKSMCSIQFLCTSWHKTYFHPATSLLVLPPKLKTMAVTFSGRCGFLVYVPAIKTII